MESRNSTRKLAGAAINGLRPYIKALELVEGVAKSNHEFRYLISPDNQSARIVRNPAPGTDTPVEEWTLVDGTDKPLSEWATLGRRVRLAFIGLKSVKEDLRAVNDHVQFTLNVLNGEAYLSRQGERVSEHPGTIEEWAKVGRPIERAQFESLNAAIDYGLQAAAQEVRARMIRLGILREQRHS